MGNPTVARKIEEAVRYEFQCPHCDADLVLYDNEDGNVESRLEVHYIDGGKRVS